MRLEQREDVARRLLDDRRVFFGATDERHAANLPFAETRRLLENGRASPSLQSIEGQPLAHLFLVPGSEPAIMKHRLRAPFVGKILEQEGKKRMHPVSGNDRALGVQALKRKDH